MNFQSKRTFLIFSVRTIFLALLLAKPTNSFSLDTSKDCFKYVAEKNWGKAESLAKKSKNPILYKIVLTQKFLDYQNSAASFEEVTKFIKNNPGWARIKKLEEISENYLTESSSKESVLNYFSLKPPHFPKSYKFYALALASSGFEKKDPEKFAHIVKKGWIYGSFSKEGEKNYLNRFKKYLSAEDHFERAEDLLRTGRGTDSVLPLLSKEKRRVIEITKALKNGSPKAKEAFGSIEPKHYSPGLLCAYLSSIKKDPLTPNTLGLLVGIKHPGEFSSELAKLRLYYAREFFEAGDYEKSYKIISAPITSTEEDLREISWFAGWISLRYLNKPKVALVYFENLLKNSKKPISLARGYYWLGRAKEASGEKEEAKKLYEKASSYSYTFYGQVASLELGRKNLILPKEPSVGAEDRKSWEAGENIRALNLIYRNAPFLANCYTEDALNSSKSPKEIKLIVEKISSFGKRADSVKAAKLASQKSVFLKGYAFPAPYDLRKSPIEKAFAYAIIRQESVFDPGAVSSAKAMGLMQLIKSTACETARDLKIRCEPTKLTKNPSYNILLGTNALKKLLKDFTGSYLLAIPAYNAGAGASKKWIGMFGDPREIRDIRKALDWMESVGYSETRNYLQRVLENLQIYRIILNKNDKLRLKDDLITYPKITG